MKPKPKSDKGGNKTESADQDFLIVAIGASAGGLEAFTDLVRNVPADTGMAFVLVQHLDPKHPSRLSPTVCTSFLPTTACLWSPVPCASPLAKEPAAFP